MRLPIGRVYRRFTVRFRQPGEVPKSRSALKVAVSCDAARVLIPRRRYYYDEERDHDRASMTYTASSRRVLVEHCFVQVVEHGGREADRGVRGAVVKPKFAGGAVVQQAAREDCVPHVALPLVRRRWG